MPNEALSEALKEAYASAPSEQVIVHTLEFRHPKFLDDNGDLMAVRVVRDHSDLTARLEQTAPLNPDEMVVFTAVGFDVELPSVDGSAVPEITITIDNASGEIMRHLDAAVITQDKIEVTYRPYLSDDLEGPHMDPPVTLTLSEVKADVSRITARARMLDVGNKAFPGETYSSANFPGIAR
jgi:hypothetical protein